MKIVPGFPGYFATDDGEIISIRTGAPRVIKARLHQGYLHVFAKTGGGRSSQKKIPVHKLVLLAYSGPKPFPEAVSRHLNGDETDNRPENLIWGTTKENAADAVRHGTAVWLRRGNAHPRTTVSDEDVLRIRSSSEDLDRQFAEEFSVTPDWIRKIRRGVGRSALHTPRVGTKSPDRGSGNRMGIHP